MFAGAEGKSQGLAAQYRRVAGSHGGGILDAGEVVVASDIDGIHLEAEEHRKLGTAAAVRVREMLGSLEGTR